MYFGNNNNKKNTKQQVTIRTLKTAQKYIQNKEKLLL